MQSKLSGRYASGPVFEAKSALTSVRPLIFLATPVAGFLVGLVLEISAERVSQVAIPLTVLGWTFTLSLLTNKSFRFEQLILLVPLAVAAYLGAAVGEFAAYALGLAGGLSDYSVDADWWFTLVMVLMRSFGYGAALGLLASVSGALFHGLKYLISLRLTKVN